MKLRFVRTPQVKKYLKDKGRRVSPSFLYALDAYIQRKLDETAEVHNGGKVTVDADVAGFVGVRP